MAFRVSFAGMITQTLFDVLPCSVAAMHAKGWPDHLIARKLKITILDVRRDRKRLGLRPSPPGSRLTESEVAAELDKWAAFIWKTAMGWHRVCPDVDMEDLHSEAIVGCLRAADNFDPRRNLRFATYAAHWMRNHLQRYVQRELTGGMVTSNRYRITRIPRMVLPDDCGLDAQLPAREEPETNDVPDEWWDALTAGLTAREAEAVLWRWRDNVPVGDIARRLWIRRAGAVALLDGAVAWMKRQGRDVPQ